MTYQEFEKKVIAKLKERTGLEIEHCNYPKINAFKQGIILNDEKKFNGAFPVIYLNPFFEEFQSEEKDIDEIVEHIIQDYEKWKFQGDSIEIKDFMEFENCKNYIFPRLINRERNEEFLKNAVSTSFCDLEVVYYVEYVDEYEVGYAMLISKKHLEIWNVSESTIIECAKQNIKRKPIYIETMRAILGRMFPKTLGKEGEEKAGQYEIYVITNKGNSYGAYEILREEVKERLREILKDNFYIIPSSIHETIVLPAKEVTSKEELKDMVREVNNTLLSQEEILSYNIYFYDFSKEKILLVE